MLAIWLRVAMFYTVLHANGIFAILLGVEAIHGIFEAPQTILSIIELKCLEYIINSNARANGLIVVWPEHKVNGQPRFIQHIMKTNNVVIINENDSSIAEKCVTDAKLNCNIDDKLSKRGTDNFSHHLGFAQHFIIESTISRLNRTLCLLSSAHVYNSRANFIIFISDIVQPSHTHANSQASSASSCKTHSSSLQLFSSTVNWKIENDNIDGGKGKENISDKNDAVAAFSACAYTDDGVDNVGGGDDDDFDVDDDADDDKNGQKAPAFVEEILNKTLAQTFEMLSTHSIYNAVVMLCYCTNDGNTCNFYTWFPFDGPSKCGKNIEHFVKLDECEYDKKTNNLLFHYAEENKLRFNTNQTAHCNHSRECVPRRKRRRRQQRQKQYSNGKLAVPHTSGNTQKTVSIHGNQYTLRVEYSQNETEFNLDRQNCESFAAATTNSIDDPIFQLKS